jgi:hypothetical protein
VANFATPTAVCRPLFQAEIFSWNTLLFGRPGGRRVCGGYTASFVVSDIGSTKSP